MHNLLLLSLLTALTIAVAAGEQGLVYNGSVLLIGMNTTTDVLGDSTSKTVEFEFEFDGKRTTDDLVVNFKLSSTKEDHVVLVKDVYKLAKKSERGGPIFKAEVVYEPIRASMYGKVLDPQPLLWIHGFNIPPEEHLYKCNSSTVPNFDVIPVIWPTAGGVTKYVLDRDNSEIAGLALKSMLEYSKRFPRKSLLAHSMGNRVLRYAADSKFEFDNIFMVAADVDADIFNQECTGERWWTKLSQKLGREDRSEDGRNIINMLKDGGKVHVLHNHLDKALWISWLQKWFKSGTKKRLGSNGADLNALCKDSKGKVTNLDCQKEWLNKEPLLSVQHTYQWDAEALAYYGSQGSEDDGTCQLGLGEGD